MTNPHNDQAVELLRGAQHLLREQSKSMYVLNLLAVEQPANGGGDGYCLLEEITDFLDEVGSEDPTNG